MTQCSYTSVKNWRMASSVWGEVGFAAMDVEAREEMDAPVGVAGEWRMRNFMSEYRISI